MEGEQTKRPLIYGNFLYQPRLAQACTGEFLPRGLVACSTTFLQLLISTPQLVSPSPKFITVPELSVQRDVRKKKFLLPCLYVFAIERDREGKRMKMMREFLSLLDDWPSTAEPIRSLHGGRTARRIARTSDGTVPGAVALPARSLARCLALPGNKG